MQQRLPSLVDPPIAFAHRGARAHAPENTIESFSLALRLGATGLESDVWVTADGVAVLDHDGVVRRKMRKQSIAETVYSDLPDHIPALADLFDSCGTDFELSLDVKDSAAYEPTADVIRAQGTDMSARTWLCDPNLERLVDQRASLSDFRLAHSTRLHRLKQGPERHAATLSAAGIDVMNMHHTDWNGGQVVLFHRFGILAFSWDLQFDHQLEGALRMGIDAVYSDHIDTMMDVHAREVGQPKSG
jgi:glycerophosphoryl diester phosphodiesterase